MRVACLLLLLVTMGSVQARMQATDPVVQPRPSSRLVDPEFGISSDAYALRREVQMLQWMPGAAGDRLAWRDAAVPSAGLGAGHRNPAALPFVAVEWQAPARMPDGVELPHARVARLGEWRLLHPDPARLPPNLAATFQRAGDVLTTATDPLAPQPGDLRLRWSELVLPEGVGFIQADGEWVPAAPVADRRGGSPAVAATSAPVEPSGPRWPYWLAASLLLALVAAMAWRQQRRR